MISKVRFTVVEPILMFIIAMKMILHTICAIFTARSDNLYHVSLLYFYLMITIVFHFEDISKIF